MHYSNPPLILTDSSITDANGTINLNDLPDPRPLCQVRLADTTPLMERLWRIALSDIEKNIIEIDGGRYFGAGTQFGLCVYTRDICYSGILGLNCLYPDIMFDSIQHTRMLRDRLMLRVSKGYQIDAIDVPWVEENISESEYLNKYHTNSYVRRTDDVLWLWCASDLLAQQGACADWEWFYRTGQAFFFKFYQPFHDPTDGLFFGQASFIDIHFIDQKATGYPRDWGIGDCVLIKSLSTNCLYVMGLQAMADAAKRLGRATEALEWESRCVGLKEAIREHLKLDDGTFAYFKHRNGNLENKREALGSAFAVISGVVDGDDAKLAMQDYPVTDGGVPLFLPFYECEKWYHNNSSWPFVDNFFIRALEISAGLDRSAQSAALLARTCIGDGTFHEVADYRTREVKGSGSQLWTAASFVDTCRRGGLL